MNTRQFNLRFLFSHDIKPMLLIFSSVIGLVIGIITSYRYSVVFSNIDRAELLASPSFFHLLIVSLIPIILLYFFLKFSLFTLCYPLVFLHGMCIGFFEASLYHLFGDGAWLICQFLLFSRYMTSIVLWFLIFRSIRQFPISIFRDFCLSAFVISVTTAFDAYIIAPFISDVFISL